MPRQPAVKDENVQAMQHRGCNDLCTEMQSRNRLDSNLIAAGHLQVLVKVQQTFLVGRAHADRDAVEERRIIRAEQDHPLCRLQASCGFAQLDLHRADFQLEVVFITAAPNPGQEQGSSVNLVPLPAYVLRLSQHCRSETRVLGCTGLPYSAMPGLSPQVPQKQAGSRLSGRRAGSKSLRARWLCLSDSQV